MLKIWGRSSSVNVQKVLWTADELGLAYQRIDAGGKFGQLDTAAYRILNPNGVIPTIEDEDGTVLWESNAIVRYLAARYGSERLWPIDPVRRADADRWMDWALTVIDDPMRILFWGFVRDPVHADGNAMAKAEDRLGECWARLDTWLAGRSFVAGDAFSMGDIPVGCQVQRCFGFPIQRPPLVHLEAWHRRLQERQGYRTWVMVPME